MFIIKALSTMLVFNGVQCTDVPVAFEVSLPIFTGLTLSNRLVFLFSFVAILFCSAALHWSGLLSYLRSVISSLLAEERSFQFPSFSDDE